MPYSYEHVWERQGWRRDFPTDWLPGSNAACCQTASDVVRRPSDIVGIESVKNRCALVWCWRGYHCRYRTDAESIWSRPRVRQQQQQQHVLHPICFSAVHCSLSKCWWFLPPSLRIITSHPAFRQALQTHFYKLAFFMIFTAWRYASAVYTVVVCLSVCLSVTRYIVSERLNVASRTWYT